MHKFPLALLTKSNSKKGKKVSVGSALDKILHSETPYADFAAMEPAHQQRLFKYLRQEYERLLDEERQLSRIKRLRPYIDSQIFTVDSRAKPGRAEGKGKNEYSQKDSFLDTWTYGDDDDGVTREPTTEWNFLDLMSETPAADLQVRPRNGPQCADAFRLCDRISSQLLLYRLTAVFGMPPRKGTDGHRSCWQASLRHQDDGSILFLQDFKGRPDVMFWGSGRGSASALKLLNFLAGPDCPHTYGGIAAGTKA